MDDYFKRLEDKMYKLQDEYIEGKISEGEYCRRLAKMREFMGDTSTGKIVIGFDENRDAIYLDLGADSSSTLAKEEAKVVEINEQESFEVKEMDALEKLIFHDALDMEKVKKALGEVLARRNQSGKLIFSQKNLVYVVYKFFMENDWLEKDNQTKFRKWMGDNFGEDFRCGKTHFDGIDKMYKNNSINQWKPTWTPYVTAAHALTEHFMGKDNPQWEKAFLKPNRYIAHGTKKVK